jgi:hypothetical protein
MTRPPQPDMITALDPNSDLCTMDGGHHDYRIHTHRAYPTAPVRQSWRCVWCHVVTCGDVTEADPCWLPYHHSAPHLTRAGVTWPISGDRPDTGAP